MLVLDHVKLPQRAPSALHVAHWVQAYRMDVQINLFADIRYEAGATVRNHHTTC